MTDYNKINNLLDILTEQLDDITQDISKLPPLLPKDALKRLHNKIYYYNKRHQDPKYNEYNKKYREKNRQYFINYSRAYYYMLKDHKHITEEQREKQRKHALNYYYKNRELISLKAKNKYHGLNIPIKINKEKTTAEPKERKKKEEIEEYITVIKKPITLYF